MLGLDRGGSCVGMAFRVPAEARAAVLEYLRARELVTRVYLEREMPVLLEAGRAVRATVFAVDRAHPQYAGKLEEAEAATIVCGASGVSGINTDYVRNTVEHLRALRIRDPRLEGVAARLGDPAAHSRTGAPSGKKGQP